MLLNRIHWLIETRRGEPLTLAALAREVGVSPAYLTRVFALATGRPLMRHLWAGRLTEAACALASDDPPSVLTAALDAGYASPEAFARAFRAAFGVSPREVIARRSTEGLPLTPAMEPLMTDTMKLDPPKIETMPDRRIVGTRARYTMETRGSIPAQWDAHMMQGIELEGADPSRWFGVCDAFGEDGGFDYIVGQEAPGAAVPAGWVAVTLPAGRWARFATREGIERMQDVWAAIYRDWIGTEGLTPREGPSAEYYPPEFDGRTGAGGYEVWIPIA